MKGFLGKLFGGGSKDNTGDEVVDVVADVLENIIEKASFSLSFDIERVEEDNAIKVELFGEDEELLTSKDGQLLDSIQLYLKRVVQHQFAEERSPIHVDCDGFREQANQSLIDLAEKLKGIAVDKGKPVYFRALPPRDRKVIHQYLANDGQVKSRSVGDGLFKKIKIYPIKGEADGGVANQPS